jgi:NAD(P)H-dependent FMN reductase
VHDRAAARGDAAFELIDLRDHPLPHLDEVLPPAHGPSEHGYTRAWAATVAPFDGYVIVTCEYNHSMPGVLKNALDHVYAEWNNKAVGLVSYGGAGGIRAAEQLRLACGALQMADVSPDVSIPLATEFGADFATFSPSAHSSAALDVMLDQVIAWSAALAPLRAAAPAAA